MKKIRLLSVLSALSLAILLVSCNLTESNDSVTTNNVNAETVNSTLPNTSTVKQ